MRFADALAEPGFGAIAEFKRRSPSAGDIRPGARVEDVVPRYEAGGARAVSVLVDDAFAGSLDDLRAARAAVGVPLLAKGFFSTEAHLRAVREAGADAALLILRDLDDATAAQLMRAADALGLDTLIEAHDRAELERAYTLQSPVIGINARDLGTFQLDRRAQLELVTYARKGRHLIVAESAINSRGQGAAAELAGAKAILVGSALMRAPDPGEKLVEIMSRPVVKVCGLTRQEDVDVAVEAGADLVGFIFARESPRRTDELLEAPDTVLRVAVFVGDDHHPDADLDQLYELEDGHRAKEGVIVQHGTTVGEIVDLPWEQDDPSHFDRAREKVLPVMLAGGLGPANVRKAIDEVSPWGVDAARSTESSPGVKDHNAVRAWVEAARA
jgi:indole-3-glycerol phosphate synthase/phosphoribosylanthranilate isomerase